jgi:uncharacterized iron-regulated membrane protein
VKGGNMHVVKGALKGIIFLVLIAVGAIWWDLHTSDSAEQQIGLVPVYPDTVESQQPDESAEQTGGADKTPESQESNGTSGPQDQPATEFAGYDEELQKYIVWEFVTRHAGEYLVAPRTAKWPSARKAVEGITCLGDEEFLVESYVDAQNRFGALVRTYFTCRVKVEGDTIMLTSLSFQE